MADKMKSVNLDNYKKEGAEEVKEELLSPAEYFEKVKGRIKEDNPEDINKIFDITLKKLKKFLITGQKTGAKALYAKALELEKEQMLYKRGYTKYVERRTIEEYIDKVADECVCIINMSSYERDIPEDIVDKVAETMDIFDEFFIVFTDYTGEKRSKVEKERREKDPILFGNIFVDGRPSSKFFFIGDWEDEYCHLTLNKMVEETAKKMKIKEDEIVYNIDDVTNLDDIENELFGTSTRSEKREELKKVKKKAIDNVNAEKIPATKKRTNTRKSSTPKKKKEE